MVSLLKRFVGGRSKTKEADIGQNDKTEVLINFSNVFMHDEIYQNVKEAISKKPKVLEIDLVGVGNLDQSICLALWHLLTERRNPHTKLVVCCNANLIDGQVLLLLAADEKRIRDHCWMEISSLKQYEEANASRVEWCSDRFGSQQEEPFFLTDYRSVFSILDRYLPCEDLSKRRMGIAETFKEYGLLNDEQEEELFQSLFKTEPAQV